MHCRKHTIFRSENRVIFGVCQGLADHFDLPVVWIRIGFLIAAGATSGVAAIAYFIAALIMKPAPSKPKQPEPHFEEDFYETDLSSRSLSLRRLKSRFDAIEARIRRMEDYVTNKSYDWERRFKAGE